MAENEIKNAIMNIKNILFSKPMPNIVIPAHTVGYKSYPCIDCGDNFLFESNYDHHVNRKSLKIIFKCRQCNVTKIFNNRCKLLAHIRKHGPRSIKIHVNDLKMEPLPLSEYLKLTNIRMETITEKILQFKSDKQVNNRVSVYCIECNTLLTDKGPPNNVRAKHFSQITGQIYTCPICTFKTPTICAFKTHLRLHLRNPPYFCPECGCLLDITSVIFPFDHDCSGFNIMKVTSKCICPVSQCTQTLLDLDTLIEHFNNKHLRRIFDVSNHSQDIKIFYKCEMCPRRLILNSRIDSHVNLHCKNFVYICHQCEQIFMDIEKLFNHCVNSRHASDDIINILNGINFNQSSLRQDTTDSSESTDIDNIYPNVASEQIITDNYELNKESDAMMLGASLNYINTVIEKNVTSCHSLAPDVGSSLSYCKSNIIDNRDICTSKSINMTGFENYSNEAITNTETSMSHYDNTIINEKTSSSDQFVETSLQASSLNKATTSYKSNITVLEQNNVAVTSHLAFQNVNQLANLDTSQLLNINSGIKSDFLKSGNVIKVTTGNKKISITEESMIACHICNKKIKETWEIIKKHYLKYHREIRCVEPHINLSKVDIGKYIIHMKGKNETVKKKSVNRKNGRNKVIIDNRKNTLPILSGINTFLCKKCDERFEDKQSLETHMISHRDPYLSYQCLECGECFAVKYSFNIHLIIEHDISDVESYIKTHESFYESAIEHQEFRLLEEPLSDNQCSVCRQKFDNEYDFERHFRSHGLAFLKKNLEIRQNNY